MRVKNFFTKEQQEIIVNAIKSAEKETSGEIRVHLESKCRGNVPERAVKMFKKLQMHKTELRNGVIIYLAAEDKKFAIFGDIGINEKVPDNFWEDVKELMRNHFIKGEFAEGVAEGILRVGEKLKEFFPYQDDDLNELSDEISMGE
jgi:uncharacterized membrane protein